MSDVYPRRSCGIRRMWLNISVMLLNMDSIFRAGCLVLNGLRSRRNEMHIYIDSTESTNETWIKINAITCPVQQHLLNPEKSKSNSSMEVPPKSSLQNTSALRSAAIPPSTTTSLAPTTVSTRMDFSNWKPNPNELLSLEQDTLPSSLRGFSTL